MKAAKLICGVLVLYSIPYLPVLFLLVLILLPAHAISKKFLLYSCFNKNVVLFYVLIMFYVYYVSYIMLHVYNRYHYIVIIISIIIILLLLNDV